LLLPIANHTFAATHPSFSQQCHALALSLPCLS
jgi:hypothetical protein